MSQHDNVIAFPAPAPHVDPAAPLRRPRLLIQAARHGQRNWNRDRDLAKLLKSDDAPPTGRALPRLRAEEAALNAARLQGAAEYDLRRHIVLMVAILAELRAVAGLGAPAGAAARA